MKREHGPTSRLLRYLPGVYQEPDQEVRIDATAPAPKYHAPALEAYLLPYEQLLLGRPGKQGGKGLEQKVASLHRYLDPRYADEEFLDWLAGWAALALLPGIPLARKRKLVANIIPLYQIRGTRRYLQQMLHLFLGVRAEIIDDFPQFEVGRHSHVGRDTFIGGGPTHFFRVTLRSRGVAGPEVERLRRLAVSVIDAAKPAHTHYRIDLVAPPFQVGVSSKVGADTYL